MSTIVLVLQTRRQFQWRHVTCPHCQGDTEPRGDSHFPFGPLTPPSPTKGPELEKEWGEWGCSLHPHLPSSIPSFSLPPEALSSLFRWQEAARKKSQIVSEQVRKSETCTCQSRSPSNTLYGTDTWPPRWGVWMPRAKGHARKRKLEFPEKWTWVR